MDSIKKQGDITLAVIKYDRSKRFF